MKGNFTSALLGGTVAAILTTATGALAGSGIGGVFNLGQTNTVGATTTLTGATSGPQLSVTNTSTGASAAGIKITPAAGKPPIVVPANAAKATNLNADLIDGFSANQLARVAYSDDKVIGWFDGGRTALRTVTLTAPQKGFVILGGATTFVYANGCAACTSVLRFRIDQATDTSTIADFLRASGPFEFVPLSYTVTVPVAKGTHTYELIASWLDNNSTGITPSFYDSSLTALYVPFNANGGQDPLPASAALAEEAAAEPPEGGAKPVTEEPPADTPIEGS